MNLLCAQAPAVRVHRELHVCHAPFHHVGQGVVAMVARLEVRGVRKTSSPRSKPSPLSVKM